MNEIGIDSLSLADFMPLTQPMVDQIAFMIQKSGTSSSRLSDIGQPSYFHQTFRKHAYFEQNVQLMHQNNKPIGAYFFSFAWDYASGYYEAKLTCQNLNDLTYKPDWPIFLDWEQGSYNGLVSAGITPTAQRVHDAVDGWVAGCRDMGYEAGFYTGGALARDLFGNSWIQTKRSQGVYFWEAHYTSAALPMVMPCDIWQYNAGDDNFGAHWMGTVVDWDKIMDDRIWGTAPPTPPSPVDPSAIPIWLKIKMAKGGSNNGKCTILL